MSVLQEILKWAERLPIWQQDAITRLIANGKLVAADMDDLYALMKVANGIPDPKGRVAKQVDLSSVPIAPSASSLVQLTSMRDLKNVNALAESQSLSIAPTGITVIYGGNGAGKSGYSRVLKRACRARDQSESIRPNAALPRLKAGKATATFDLFIDGVASSAQWIDGQTSPDVLGAIAIFDARCARLYVDKQDDFSYVPYGLDVLEALAKALNHLKGMVEAEQLQSAPNTLPYASLSTTQTAVGALLRGLNARTSSSVIEALSAISEPELVRHVVLEKALKEGNPKEKAQQLTLLRGRILKLGERCTEKLALLSDSALSELRILVDASWSAKNAADLAAKMFKATPGLLPGTGGDAWQELFTAARKFALESHVGHDFPNLGSDSACPLCQQLLGQSADRIIEFDKFIQGAAEKLAREKRLAAKLKYETMFAADLALQFDAELKLELEAINVELSSQCEALQSELLNRRVRIKLACAEGGDWSTVGVAPCDPRTSLDAVAGQLQNQIAVLEKTTDEKQLAALEAEYRELEARKQLVAIKSAVLDATSKMDTQVKLNACLPALRTNPISLKATELVDKIVSKGLADALNAEFNQLNVGHLKVAPQSSTVKGKTLPIN